MKRLMLLRHGKSSWADNGLADRDRPLAERGRSAGVAMADAIAARGLLPDRVLCSPAVRAKETLATLEQNLAAGTEVAFLEDLYSGPEEDYRDAIAAGGGDARRLMVIGHNPRIQATALALIGAGKKDARARLAAKFPTGALVVIEFEDDGWSTIAAGSGRLDTFLRPRDLPGGEDD